jgi:diguanylate cyclase (GGDEF)-like protein
VKSLLSIFRVETDNVALVRAQMRVFARQIPLLYVILLANTGFVSLTHFNSAPLWLSSLIPLGFAGLAIVRLIGWWRMRHTSLTDHEAVRRLRGTVLLCFLLGVAFTSWGLAIYPYGDAFAKAHIIIYMSVTLIGCVFCLMNFRAAAFTLTLVVIVPTTVFFLLQEQPVLIAIALNVMIVTAVLMFVLTTHYKDFATMVAQKQHLEEVNHETRRLSDENRKLANRDSLTGLPNRRSFIAQIEARVAAVPGETFTLGIVDLDGFKAVNDLYGHATGDALLVEASRRMASIAEPGVIFARLGGDEFGIITSSVTDLAAFGRTLCEILRQPYELDDVTAEVTSSCGFAEYAEDCRTTKELFEQADYALYQAKGLAGGNTVVFSSTHRDELRRVHEIDQALRNADLNHELALVYQPIVNTSTGAVVSFEALARWRNASLGNISPAQFITSAEKSSLINRITITLLRKLLNEMATWPEDIGASFNLSARTLTSPDAMLQIVSLMQQCSVNPGRLEFEVTETTLMIDFENSQRALNLLRNLGARVALDDFGIGYSSLSYVHELPLDKIKIDRKFVSDMTSSTKAENVVKTVVDLCNNLHLLCVAEGVETQEQAESLRRAGCMLAQGYFIGKPMPPRDVPRYLESHHARKAVRKSARPRQSKGNRQA